MLELGLSRNKYQILRKALHEKGHNILPSYKAIQEKKTNYPTKSTKNNEELKELRAAEKSRIQEEFKVQMGLNIDKPLSSCGSTNDGNTARRFFRDFEITSKITGIDKELLRRVNTILMALNSKHKINGNRFGEYTSEISKLLVSLYPWRELNQQYTKYCVMVK